MKRCRMVRWLVPVFLVWGESAAAQVDTSHHAAPPKAKYKQLTPPEPLVDIYELLQYPTFAKRAGIEGIVRVAALVSLDGTIDSVEVEHSDNDFLTEAAVNAMKRMRYTPARCDGAPCKIWYIQQIRFELRLPEE